MIVLKRFQSDAVDAGVSILLGRGTTGGLEDLGRASQARRCVVLTAPTGTGKTLMAGQIASRVSREDRVIWFWFAPFSGIVGQAADALATHCPALRVRDPYLDRSIEELRAGDIYVLTWASLAVRSTTIRRLNKGGEEALPMADVLEHARRIGWRIGLVVDEAHHSFPSGGAATSFVRDVLRPHHIILATATPDDAGIEEFRRTSGLPAVSRISISRDDAVEAGLIKTGVRVVAFAPPAQGASAPVDFKRTALRFGVETHRHVAKALTERGHAITPLLLVQVDSVPASPDDARRSLESLGIAPAAIRIHTAEEPDPDLLAIANDESVEVLIFKMAVALGFDAPRAWTLVSMRRSRDIDFGVQVLGRLMRVDRRLSGIDLSRTSLDFAYAVVADPDVQEGLISAADRISALKTEVRRLTPAFDVRSVPLPGGEGGRSGGASRPKASHGDDEQPARETSDGADRDRGSAAGGRWTSPRSDGGAQNPSDPFGFELSGQNARTDSTPSTVTRPRRGDLTYPTALLREAFPLDETRIAECVAARIRFDAHARQALTRQGVEIVRRTMDAFSAGPDRSRRELVWGELAVRSLIMNGQAALFENDYVNGRSLLPSLAKRLEIECRQAGMTDWLQSTAKLEEGVRRILGSDASLLRKALRECLADHVDVVPAAPIPEAIQAPATQDASPSNIYGVRPPGLNGWERAFAAILDDDATGTVRWWHRNEPRKPWSVAICAPGTIHNFYPDFVVGVKGRTTPDEILLIETKLAYRSEDSMAKARSNHKVYGRVMMLTRTEDGQWWIVRYDSERGQTLNDVPFAIGRMPSY